MSNWSNTEVISLKVPFLLAGSALPVSVCALLILTLLLGGGAAQGFWSDAIVQVASLPLLGVMLYRLARVPPDRAARWPLFLLFGALALPLLQLIPMPPALWSALAGRVGIAAGYRAADMALPWLPISLDPAATWRSLWSMLPAVALFLAALFLDWRERRFLVLLVLAVVFVSVPLDMLQMMGGAESPLRFYAITNIYSAVGFFANSNHNAAFLYGTIPFAAAWAIGVERDQRRHRVLGLVLTALLLAAIIMGLAIVHSRAGLALGLVAGLSCIALAWRHGLAKSRRALLLVAVGGNLFAILIAFQFGFVALSQRVAEENLMQDRRWQIAAVTSQAAAANLPFGTGFGTFVPIYRMFAPRILEQKNYVNHAHDDWLELWLEGGLPALALSLGFLGWFSVASARLWRDGVPGGRELDKALARAGSILIVLLLLHSTVDYPLRTAAMMTLFALACALLIPPRRGASPLEVLAAAGPEPHPAVHAKVGPSCRIRAELET